MEKKTVCFGNGQLTVVQLHNAFSSEIHLLIRFAIMTCTINEISRKKAVMDSIVINTFSVQMMIHIESYGF
jgi:hypothetical protein